MRETELQTPQRHSQPKKFTAWFVHSLNEVESLPFSQPLSLNIHLQRPLSQSNDKMRETELQTPQRHSQPKKFTAWFVHSLNEVESLPFNSFFL